MENNSQDSEKIEEANALMATMRRAMDEISLLFTSLRDEGFEDIDSIKLYSMSRQLLDFRDYLRRRCCK